MIQSTFYIISYHVIKFEKPFDQIISLGQNNPELNPGQSQTDTPYIQLTEEINPHVLRQSLLHFREEYPYEIDGMIVTNNYSHHRNTSGNPDYAFAFKMVMDEQMAETVVLGVKWSPSKDGFLKPRVQVQPVNFIKETALDNL